MELKAMKLWQGSSEKKVLNHAESSVSAGQGAKTSAGGEEKTRRYRKLI